MKFSSFEQSPSNCKPIWSTNIAFKPKTEIKFSLQEQIVVSLPTVPDPVIETRNTQQPT